MKKKKNYIKKWILKKIKNNDGFIEMFMMIIIFFFLISILLSVAPPFIAREKLNIISRRVVDKVAYDGKVDSSTHIFINELINKANLQNKNVTYAFNGNVRPDGKIQLNEEFTFTINATEQINLTGFGDFHLDMLIKKENTGVSEVFYKSSEL